MEATYSYHLRGWSIAYLLIMCAIFACLMIFLAFTEPDNILGIPCGKSFGSLLYSSSAFVVMWMALWLLHRRKVQIKNHYAIVFGATSVTLPISLGSVKLISIPYQDIESVTRERVERTGLKFIRIEYGQLQCRISDMGFTTAADFDTVYQLLIEKQSNRG
jgi:hypothetical protein